MGRELSVFSAHVYLDEESRDGWFNLRGVQSRRDGNVCRCLVLVLVCDFRVVSELGFGRWVRKGGLF